MAVQARVNLQEARATSSGTEVTLVPVYSSDPDSPNYSFSKYTPSGSIKLFITNPAAIGAFEFGKDYDVTFTETVQK